MHNNDSGTLIYLLEDEKLFYGYAQHPDFVPRVKTGWADVLAVRWCRGFSLPKGDEDVRKLYLEALDIIRENDDLIRMYLHQKDLMIDGKGKKYVVDIEEQVKRTQADPVLSKYFL
jgi:hypothetical protein